MIALLVSTLLFSALPEDAPIARVGPEVISLAQLRERARATRAAGGVVEAKGLLQDLVNETLMAQEADALGLQKDPQVMARVRAERRRLAGKLLLDREGDKAAKPDPAQLLALYHLGGDRVHLELVVLASEDDALQALKRLRAGAAMAAEAARSLDGETAAHGGDAGERSRGELPRALEGPAFAAPLNTFAGPVKLSVGYAVFRVLERSIAPPEGLAAKQEELEKFAQVEARSQLRQHLLVRLRRAANVQVDTGFLKSTGVNLDGDPAQLNHVVAKVGAVPIRYGEVLVEVRRLFGGKEGGHASGPGVKTEMAWSLADQLLLADAAAKRGLDTDPQVRAASRQGERDEMVRALAARLRSTATPPAPAEIEAYYGSHRGGFQVPESRPCSHLVVPDQATAERLRQRLTAGERFDELARRYSTDASTAEQGGGLGPFTSERLAKVAASEPALAAMLRTVPAGQVSVPVKSRLGWHLVRCEVGTVGHVLPLESVRPAIVAKLTAARGDELVREHLRALRAQAQVTVDPHVLQSLDSWLE